MTFKEKVEFAKENRGKRVKVFDLDKSGKPVNIAIGILDEYRTRGYNIERRGFRLEGQLPDGCGWECAELT